MKMLNLSNGILFFATVTLLFVSCLTSTTVKELEPLPEPIYEGIAYQIILGVLGERAEIIEFDSKYDGDRLEAETKDGRILVLWRSSKGDTYSGTLANRFNPKPHRERVYVRRYNESACFKGFLKPAKGCWEARIGDTRFNFQVVDPLDDTPPIKLE